MNIKFRASYCTFFLGLIALSQLINCNFTSPKTLSSDNQKPRTKTPLTINQPVAETKALANTKNLAESEKTSHVSTQKNLAVPKESPYYNIYQKALADPEINPKALNKTFKFFLKHKGGLITKDLCLGKDNLKNKNTIRNQDCIIIADYTKTKLQKRLHVFKLKDEKIYSFYTAHGKGSNKRKDALRATKFSNTPNSLQTSLGFYLTDTSYTSSKDTFGPGPNNGIKLDGLSCTNNNARRRYIVLHTAKYVTEDIKNEDSIGYSEGCITFPPTQQKIMLTCTEGALLYTHADY